MVDPARNNFGDEKLLKGEEPFICKVRLNPITGEIPALLTTPDFRNTYALTGFCCIDTRSPALFFSVHESNNDATQFAMDVEAAIETVFFQPGSFCLGQCSVSCWRREHSAGELAVD